MENMKCNLLIVDDELFVLDWMVKLFSGLEEYRIYTAASSAEAMKIIRNTDIQVALSDICMPELNGLEVLRSLRKLRPNCQVVFLTGYSNFEYIYEAMQYEGVRYLLKIENDKKILDEVAKARYDYLKLVNPDLKITKPEVNNTADTEEDTSYYSQSPIVMLIKQYVDGHLSEDLSLTYLADKFHFNPSYLSRLFKTVIGINLSDYIFTCRMNKSKELLAKEYMRIEEVAGLVGYQSSKSFTRLFKKFQGVTPQEYRQNSQLNIVNSEYQK